jgi:glutaredoxin
LNKQLNRLPFTTIALIVVVLFGGWKMWHKHQASVSAEDAQVKYADLIKQNQAAANGREVINLYTATWCGYCKHLKESLDASGVPYVDHDVETSAEGKQYSDSHSFNGVPVTVVGQETIEGYDADRLESVFYRAGYKVGGLQL